MPKMFNEITQEHKIFIEKQHLFFVATAPLQASGHINLSPKGLDSFRVISSTCVAYLDMTGSGNETSAHLLENGRITFMFTAFEGNPLILRLYGQGRVILPEHEEWSALAAHFTVPIGARQIILADVELVQTSCGFGVPLYDFKEERQILTDWAKKQGDDGVRTYQLHNNKASIDGLPTLLGVERSA
ncbi:MAG: pyridoxamine 5'-phosphate oxidase family protein [Candidatus Kapaibacterium sp.]|nr:MAG: pyridoxamine 5'-phosphate oxidase family protein [Candidatus Kapabacteria bacterium]